MRLKTVMCIFFVYAAYLYNSNSSWSHSNPPNSLKYYWPLHLGLLKLQIQTIIHSLFFFFFLLCWFSPASVSCFLMLYKKMNRPTPLQVQNYCQQNVPEESKEGCQAANAAALVCGIVWLHFGGSGDALTLFCQNHPLISNKICHRRQTDIHLVVRNFNQNKC